MLTLSLVRHGQTVYNAENRLQGWCDSPLTPEGLAGVRTTAGYLARRPFDAAYVSSSGRAQTTAYEILAHHPWAPPVTDPDLREFRFGDLEARPEADLLSRYDPDAMFASVVRGTFAGFLGGESAGEYLARVSSAFARIERAHKDGRVLIVSHGLTLLTYLTMIDRRPMAPLPNASISTVEVYPGGDRRVIAVGVDPARLGMPDVVGALATPEPAI